MPSLVYSVPLALHQATTNPHLRQKLLHIHRQVWVRLFCWRKWWSRRTRTHLLWELQNYNSLLNNCQQENVGSHQKYIPHFQGQRRSPRKTVGGVKSHLESNVIPARDARRAQTEPCVHQTWQRLIQTCLWVSECLLWSCGSAVDCCWDRGSGCSGRRYGISPLGRDHH